MTTQRQEFPPDVPRPEHPQPAGPIIPDPTAARAVARAGLTPPPLELNAPEEFVPDWIPRARDRAKAEPAPTIPTPSANLPSRQAWRGGGGDVRTRWSESDAIPTTPPPIAIAAKTTFDPTTVAAPSRSLKPPTLDLEREIPEDDKLTSVLLAAPPWLLSLLVHMIGIVILGLWALPFLIDQDIRIEAIFADSLGEQLESEPIELSDQMLDEQPLVTPNDMTMSEQPLASPEAESVELFDQQQLAANMLQAHDVGLALSGREPGMKETLLLAYGGSATTEAAVAEALRWLKRNQRSDGSWSLSGPYSDGSSTDNRVAGTAMALLAFQGAGFTHQSTREMLGTDGTKQDVDYRKVVQRGWNNLLKWQSEDGNFWAKGKVDNQNHVLYSQAQATIAICELYGMTRDEAFRRPAQRAVNYAVQIQDADGIAPDGGWRYVPGQDSDTSVTGWFVMALQSARMAGLDVPSEVFDKISRYLDAVTEDGTYYSYTPDYASKLSMTAEALLCRQYLGWHRDDPRLQRGVTYIAQTPIDWSDPNTYYWYYATQVMHHMEGDAWFAWNRVMARELPAMQVKEGPNRGSWNTTNDVWAQGGGRLYMTCMCTYMLEVYYRHLPIYAKMY